MHSIKFHGELDLSTYWQFQRLNVLVLGNTTQIKYKTMVFFKETEAGHYGEKRRPIVKTLRHILNV